MEALEGVVSALACGGRRASRADGRAWAVRGGLVWGFGGRIGGGGAELAVRGQGRGWMGRSWRWWGLGSRW